MQIGILAVLALINLESITEAQFANEGYTKQRVHSEHVVERQFGGNYSLLKIKKQKDALPVPGGSGINTLFDPLLSYPATSFDLSGLGTSAKLVNRRFQNDQIEMDPLINFGQGLPAGARHNSASQNVLYSATKKKIAPAQPLLSNDHVGTAASAPGQVLDQLLNTGRSTVIELFELGVGTDLFGDVSLEAIGSVNIFKRDLGHVIRREVPHKQPVIKDPILQGRRVIESILKGRARVNVSSSVVLPDVELDTIVREASRSGDGQ